MANMNSPSLIKFFNDEFQNQIKEKKVDKVTQLMDNLEENN